ncbi:aldehyde-activating protein [Reinekea forsetii]|nr:aldehyde-activating protein [Reinekea forsetii]
MLLAQCHCGQISVTATHKPSTVTECNCSICGRFGARWAYYKQIEVTVKTTGSETHTYRWGDEDIDFHHCPNCGCMTHYTGTGKQNEQDRVAINTRMCNPQDMIDITVRHFDGADTWQYLD